MDEKSGQMARKGKIAVFRLFSQGRAAVKSLFHFVAHCGILKPPHNRIENYSATENTSWQQVFSLYTHVPVAG